MSSTVTASARLYTRANSEYHSIADGSQTGLDPAGNMYVAGWFYFTTVTVGESMGLVCKGSASGNYEYYLYFDRTGNRILFQASGNGTSIDTATGNNFGAPSAGVWYFIEGYYDGTNIAVCVNRGTDDTTAHNTGIYNGTSTFMVGQDGFGTGMFNGRATKVCFYSAVPSTTIRDALYNSGNGVNYHDLTTAQKTNLVSWWDGAETSGNLLDAHGTNNLTDNNTVTSATGKVTYTAEDAADFNKANDEYLSITNAAQTGLSPGTNDFYVCGWSYLEALDVSSNCFIVCKANNGTTAQWEYMFRWENNTNAYQFYIYDTSGTYRLATLSNPNMEFGVWVFWEFYVDNSANNIYMAVNRTATGPTAFTNALTTGSLPFTIGTDAVGTEYWDGRHANIAVYSAIPSTAVRDALYGRGFGIHYSDLTEDQKANLVSWWKLDEASGTRYDSHGSNNLTDNNTVTSAAGVAYDAPAVVTFKPTMMLLGVG